MPDTRTPGELVHRVRCAENARRERPLFSLPGSTAPRSRKRWTKPWPQQLRLTSGNASPTGLRRLAHDAAAMPSTVPGIERDTRRDTYLAAAQVVQHGLSLGAKNAATRRGPIMASSDEPGPHCPAAEEQGLLRAHCTLSGAGWSGGATIPAAHGYENYGGRGIASVRAVAHVLRSGSWPTCPPLRPSRRHSIDRWPDNNGNYEPGNGPVGDSLGAGQEHPLQQEATRQRRGAHAWRTGLR